MISRFEATPEGKERLQDIKRKYYNESLEDFVKNSNETNRVLEFNGRLYRNI